MPVLWIGWCIVAWSSVMDRKLQLRGNEDVARRWHALAERRRIHFVDMHRSGRWRKYYPREHVFLAQMRESSLIVDAWRKVAFVDTMQHQ
jgi:uncharacterized repeat protein (TIGR03809 family)